MFKTCVFITYDSEMYALYIYILTSTICKKKKGKKTAEFREARRSARRGKCQEATDSEGIDCGIRWQTEVQ